MKYETIVCVNPDKEKENNYIVNDIEYIIEKAGGKYTTEKWGCRKLAFPIKKHDKAIYTWIEFEVADRLIGSKVVERLQKFYESEENIIKHIIIKKD